MCERLWPKREANMRTCLSRLLQGRTQFGWFFFLFYLLIRIRWFEMLCTTQINTCTLCRLISRIMSHLKWSKLQRSDLRARCCICEAAALSQPFTTSRLYASCVCSNQTLKWSQNNLFMAGCQTDSYICSSRWGKAQRISVPMLCIASLTNHIHPKMKI